MAGRAVSTSYLPIFDGTQNFQSAAAEEIQIQRQFAVDHGDQRQAALEQAAGITDFVAQQLAKGRRGVAPGNGGFVYLVAFRISASGR